MIGLNLGLNIAAFQANFAMYSIHWHARVSSQLQLATKTIQCKEAVELQEKKNGEATNHVVKGSKAHAG
jgi:hypothetical protein